ncbi:hypothetical protein [Saccharothrix xinjiangensis]|uniref:Uncharacterized protein n=1 Tax=Saccharothrix xinjiangensis TaxID=204798 RepID=A0ABV9XVY3_9PSEU
MSTPHLPGTPDPDLLAIVQTLVATMFGDDADPELLDPDQFTWVERNGHPVITIRSSDRGVILTKFHPPHCAFVTGADSAECDCD